MFSTSFPIVYTHDVNRAARFYRDLLGFVETYRFPPTGELQYMALELAGAKLGIGGPPPHVRASGSGFEICIYTASVDDAVAFLRERGVPVRQEPADQP